METELLIPIIIGLVEALKRAKLPIYLAPIATVALGVFGVFLFGEHATALDAVKEGLIIGLSAAGLYSGFRATVRI